MQLNAKHLPIAFAALALLAGAAQASDRFKNSGMKKYLRKNYAGAVVDFNKHLAASPADASVILLRGLSKSLLDPEDVVGACADFAAVEADLQGMNVETYCRGQTGW